MKFLRVNPRHGNYMGRPILRREIEEAQQNTRSGAEAARYLGVSYNTYKKYSKLYGIFEQHKNPSGKGIPKSGMAGHKYPLEEILEGKHPTYNVKLLRERLIKSGMFDEKCMLCGFEERRITDYKVPLMLVFKDGDRTNHKLENLMLLCYNCAYLTVGELNRINPMKVRTLREIDDEAVSSKDEEYDMSEDEMKAAIEEAKKELEDNEN